MTHEVICLPYVGSQNFILERMSFLDFLAYSLNLLLVHSPYILEKKSLNDFGTSLSCYVICAHVFGDCHYLIYMNASLDNV